MCIKNTPRAKSQRGVTLVELVVFIIIIGVGVVGLMSVTGSTIMHSADPMVRKQAIAIAESLLLEIEQKPFTWCDPTDANLLTATNASECATTPEDQGPETGESRYSNTKPFNNVNDYKDFKMPDTAGVCVGICPLGAPVTPIPNLSDYTAEVKIEEAGTDPDMGLTDKTAALKITVTVTGRGETIQLVGYRTRYAPNSGG